MIAKYKTRRGAERYAAELKRVHPFHSFDVVPGTNFNFNIRVYSPNKPVGSPVVLAARRPRHFLRTIQGNTP